MIDNRRDLLDKFLDDKEGYMDERKRQEEESPYEKMERVEDIKKEEIKQNNSFNDSLFTENISISHSFSVKKE